MQLHQLHPKHQRDAKRPRVGRGGKRGTTGGKGTKGQKSRSGHRIRPAIRDLVQRLPKLRGYANKPLADSPAVLTLTMLGKINSPVTLKSIVAAGYAKQGQPVKILSNGELTKAVTVEGVAVSKSAKEAIEKAGGTVTLPVQPVKKAQAEPKK
jgi:large subunit ribosomal protein L15